MPSASTKTQCIRAETQKLRDLLQDERNKTERLQSIISQMEDDVAQFNVDLLQKDKSISSLQFEKAALQATVERLRVVESSEYCSCIGRHPANLEKNYTNRRLR